MVQPIELLAAGVAALAAEDVSDLDAASLAEQLVVLRQQIDACEAQFSRRVEAFDRRGGAALDGSASTAAWLRGHCRLSVGVARDRVVTARHLADDLPATREAFAEGAISYAHVKVIAGVTRQMPEEMVGEAEGTLAGAARVCDPVRLHRSLTDLRHQLQPERVVRAEADALDQGYVHASTTMDGMVAVDALLDPETGSLLLSLLNAEMQRPNPEAPRTRGQRQLDAFRQILRKAIDSDRLPSVRGERPQVSVVVDLDTLEGRLGSQAAMMSWTGPISGEAARRMACDAGVSRVITRGKSQILDVGRKTRTVTPAQWKGLVVRDQGCRFNGCGRPPDWCIAHHVWHWALGGPTDLANLIMLCEFHHHAVHEGGFGIRLDPDGTVTVTPPSPAAAA